jgi:hypothetical protein
LIGPLIAGEVSAKSFWLLDILECVVWGLVKGKNSVIIHWIDYCFLVVGSSTNGIL